MKPSSITKSNYFPYILLFIQPIFMATNTIVARGGVESVPPISLAFWRWFAVFIILFPFFYDEIFKNKKEFKKLFIKLPLIFKNFIKKKWKKYNEYRKPSPER